jgi:hypothetical protein
MLLSLVPTGPNPPSIITLFDATAAPSRWLSFANIRSRVVRKNSIRAIGAEYEHESHGMMSA